MAKPGAKNRTRNRRSRQSSKTTEAPESAGAGGNGKTSGELWDISGHANRASNDNTSNTTMTLNTDANKTVPAPDFVESAYLDYAMTVILDRALPSLGDGLKPVQRRIVYAMSELGLSAQSKPKKSARTIGDVIGKFHPHGDTACYEAMVLMAQAFSYRYPLIDGQGNWGAIDDPKSFAAMRYTEAKLTPYAGILTGELAQGTTQWRPNFDSTLEEPVCLPARLPNILLNGTSGIAVGMSTDIPPHNLTEVAEACIALLSKPKTNDDELYNLIRGPDFPGGGEIIDTDNNLRNIYATGTGSIKIRATVEIIDGNIVITSLPYQVPTVRVIEQITTQIRNKKLPFIRDLRDESDADHPVRIVITPKGRKVSPESLISHLLATTDLERNYRVNLNVITGSGAPQVLSLKELLKQWLKFRTAVVKQRLEWRLSLICERLEILDGFLVVYLNVDEVIRIVREAEDPQAALMERFQLSEMQAHAILELKLRKLARLEHIKIEAEHEELSKEKEHIEKTLKSEARLKTLIKKEIRDDIKQHGDDRRTIIRTGKPHEATALDMNALAADEPVSVIVSKEGWVRAAKGHDIDGEQSSYHSGDEHLQTVKTTSKAVMVFFDNTGRCFCAPVNALPSAKGYGEPLSSRFNLNARLVAAVYGRPEEECLLVSSAGDAMRVRFENMMSSTRNGKQIMNVADGTEVVAVSHILRADKEEPPLALGFGSAGHLLALPAEELPLMTRGKGIRLIKIKPGQSKVVAAYCLSPGQSLEVRYGMRKKNMSYDDAKAYTGKRGTTGKLLPKQSRKVHRVAPVPGP